MIASGRQIEEEAIIHVPDTYRFAVPITNSVTPAIYLVQALGNMDAKSAIHTFPYITWEDWRVKLVDGSADVNGTHEFHFAVLLDKIEIL
jgi:hypothetical protein